MNEAEILSTRLLHFPRELVFRAWTEPEHLARWWGPKGFTNTFHEFDLRPGGAWRFHMHGPDGKDYPNESVFRAIASPEQLVFDHVSPPVFQVVATFAEQGNQTGLSFRMIFPSAEKCAKVRAICEPCNEENFDRLEVELARMVTPEQEPESTQ